MGWDIGGRGINDELAAMRNVARVCAWWTLAAGALVIVVRYWNFEHRWFVLTGAAANMEHLLETDTPGVFAAGDVRSGSTKRCATAVGEGAMAVQFAHAHLARTRAAEEVL